MTTTSHLAQTLENERKRQHMSVTELIAQAGVSRAAVYRLLKGEDVQLTTLLAVSNTLGMDLVAMPASIATLLPDASAAAPGGLGGPKAPARGQDAPAGRMAPLALRLPPRATPPPEGPLSAVAARAARLQDKLKRSRP